MLALFPQILFLAPISATVIRFALACVLAVSAWKSWGRFSGMTRALAVVEAALAAMLVLGAWTQAVALAATILLVSALSLRSRALPTSTVLLSIVLALSLVVTGAGVFAIDLPL